MARDPLACACGMRGPKPYDEGGAFCHRGLGRRAALLHRDQEVSPTGIYEAPSLLGIPVLGFVVSVVVEQGLYYIVKRWRAQGGAM